VKARFPKVLEQMKAALAKWMDLKREVPAGEIFGGRDEMMIQAGE
jgi:hypothetical protein